MFLIVLYLDTYIYSIYPPTKVMPYIAVLIMNKRLLKMDLLFFKKCFEYEQLLDWVYLERPLQSTTVYYQAHKHKSIIHHLYRCYIMDLKHLIIFLELFFAPINKSFWSNDAQISQCQPHDDQVLLVLLQHQCFLAQQFILDDLYKIVREQCTATMEFVIPVFKDYRMVFR